MFGSKYGIAAARRPAIRTIPNGISNPGFSTRRPKNESGSVMRFRSIVGLVCRPRTGFDGDYIRETPPIFRLGKSAGQPIVIDIHPSTVVAANEPPLVLTMPIWPACPARAVASPGRSVGDLTAGRTGERSNRRTPRLKASKRPLRRPPVPTRISWR